MLCDVFVSQNFFLGAKTKYVLYMNVRVFVLVLSSSRTSHPPCVHARREDVKAKGHDLADGGARDESDRTFFSSTATQKLTTTHAQ